jgi:hypothetical protein
LAAHSQATLAFHARAIGKSLALSPQRHSLLAMLPSPRAMRVAFHERPPVVFLEASTFDRNITLC